MLLKKRPDLVLFDLSFCNIPDQCLELVFWRIQFVAVQVEKSDASNGRRALVSIMKWVVLAEMKKICCSHMMNILVEILASEGRRGLCDR